MHEAQLARNYKHVRAGDCVMDGLCCANVAKMTMTRHGQDQTWQKKPKMQVVYGHWHRKNSKELCSKASTLFSEADAHHQRLHWHSYDCALIAACYRRLAIRT